MFDEELVHLAVSRGKTPEEALAWAEKVKQQDAELVKRALLTPTSGRYVPLQNLIRELEGRLLREDSDR